MADKPLLSAREMAVVRLVAQGKTNDEIASEAHYAPDSVRIVVSRILGKTGERNRVALAVRAVREGWV